MKYLLVIILLGVFSCNSTKKSTEKEDQLLSSYQVSLLHSKLSLDKKPTLKLDFESNKISGNAGCNDYGANMTISENEIKFSKFIATKMYCGNMKIEKEFLKKLSNVDHYIVKEDNLFLYDKGDVLLITCKSITE
jgi:heat shock protein HslJ